MTKKITIIFISVIVFIISFQGCKYSDSDLTDFSRHGTFSFSGDSLSVQYFGADDYVQISVPEYIEQCFQAEAQETESFGVFVHPRITAFVSGGKFDDSYDAAEIYCTTNEGKSWFRSILPSVREAQDVGGGNIFSSVSIGFTSSLDGWIIGSRHYGMGNQENFIYLSHDGGKTWEETNNINDQYARVLRFGLFTSESIGFMCFRFEFEENPFPIYRTADGGTTWSLALMPEIIQPENSYYEFSALQFHDSIYELTLSNHEYAEDILTLTSSDFGVTWNNLKQKRNR
ncbi:MAG: glycoside hydrolase [Clostridiales Family XIII bacterium]|nr:glycoside hydrolase [Clostridiales Family XIII bacterium]